MCKQHFKLRLIACMAGLTFGHSSPAFSMPDDPIAKLIELISYEAEGPELDVTQASVSSCTLTVETLRVAPDRSIISTSTTVSIPDLYGNNSVFYLTPGEEDDGAKFGYFVTEETATATYRVDNPSRSSRQNFHRRFGRRCWGGDMCQYDFTPRQLYFSVQSSSPAKRAELRAAFRDVIEYCRRQID